MDLSGLKYQQIQPPEFLKNYVRYFYALETKEQTPARYTFRTMADGGPGLLFQPREDGSYSQGDKMLPELFLYGQSTTHVETCLNGTFTTLGVLFYPHALKSVFGLDAHELTDLCLDLNAEAVKQGYRLSEQLAEAPTVEARVGVLSAYLFFLIQKNSVLTDRKMEHAITQIVQSGGSLSLKALHKDLALSERSVERKFKQYVGLSPKLFARICRFQSSLNQIRTLRHEKLSDVAYENEYADQSHLIRTFREFSGMSPNEYQKQFNALAKNLPIFSSDDPLVGFVLSYGLQRA
jgi:AraC-like DNA-binding protein